MLKTFCLPGFLEADAPVKERDLSPFTFPLSPWVLTITHIMIQSTHSLFERETKGLTPELQVLRVNPRCCYSYPSSSIDDRHDSLYIYSQFCPIAWNYLDTNRRFGLTDTEESSNAIKLSSLEEREHDINRKFEEATI